MKPYALVLSVAIAVSMATAAQAAKHARHHHKAAVAEASSTDWAGNPHMDITAQQRDAFFRDAFNPAGAK